MVHPLLVMSGMPPTTLVWLVELVAFVPPPVPDFVMLVPKLVGSRMLLVLLVTTPLPLPLPRLLHCPTVKLTVLIPRPP